MTLDNLKGSSQYALCLQNMRFSEPNTKFVWGQTYTDSDEDSPSAKRLLVSGNVRFIRIFEGFPGEGASNDSGVIKNMNFHGFRRYVFSILGNETNVFSLLSSFQRHWPRHIWRWTTINDLNVHYYPWVIICYLLYSLIHIWPERSLESGVLSQINKKAQLTLWNPRDVKACKNCSNSTCFVSFHRIPFPRISKFRPRPI